MGSGISQICGAVNDASTEEVHEACAKLSVSDRERLSAALQSTIANAEVTDIAILIQKIAGGDPSKVQVKSNATLQELAQAVATMEGCASRQISLIKEKDALPTHPGGELLSDHGIADGTTLTMVKVQNLCAKCNSDFDPDNRKGCKIHHRQAYEEGRSHIEDPIYCCFPCCDRSYLSDPGRNHGGTIRVEDRPLCNHMTAEEFEKLEQAEKDHIQKQQEASK